MAHGESAAEEQVVKSTRIEGEEREKGTLTLIMALLLSWVVGFYRLLLAYPKRQLKDFDEPPRWLVALAYWFVSLFFPVKCTGIEHVRTMKRKTLFVGNHQILALDVPGMFSHLQLEGGVLPRALADKLHFRVPLWKQFLERMGAFEGTRESCAELMADGQPVLVFPGGSGEVFRSQKNDPYELIWKDRAGFAKLAAENGYDIIPFASVGISDALFVPFELPMNFFYRLLGDKKRASNPCKTPAKDANGKPRVAGEMLPLPLPWLKFQANYVWYGKPISCAEFAGDPEKVWTLREKVRIAVEGGVKECLERRLNDGDRFNVPFWNLFGSSKREAEKTEKTE